MDFLPDGTLYLEDPAALKIPETSTGSGATATLQGPGSGRRLPTLDTSSGFIDDGTLRVADPDALAVPDPNTWRAADPITPVKPISGSGSNWEWDWETGLVRETWMSTIQQDQHAWEKVGRSWDWLAGCCCSGTSSLNMPFALPPGDGFIVEPEPCRYKADLMDLLRRLRRLAGRPIETPPTPEELFLFKQLRSAKRRVEHFVMAPRSRSRRNLGYCIKRCNRDRKERLKGHEPDPLLPPIPGLPGTSRRVKVWDGAISLLFAMASADALWIDCIRRCFRKASEEEGNAEAVFDISIEPHLRFIERFARGIGYDIQLPNDIWYTYTDFLQQIRHPDYRWHPPMENSNSIFDTYTMPPVGPDATGMTPPAPCRTLGNRRILKNIQVFIPTPSSSSPADIVDSVTRGIEGLHGALQATAAAQNWCLDSTSCASRSRHTGKNCYADLTATLEAIGNAANALVYSLMTTGDSAQTKATEAALGLSVNNWGSGTIVVQGTVTASYDCKCTEHEGTVYPLPLTTTPGF
jgi:hypothetical protein